MLQTSERGIAMAPRYNRGQRVVVMPVKNDSLSTRDSVIEAYVGKDGLITDYYWINSPTSRQSIYVYTVKIKEDNREIVVHEDEIKSFVE
jgi:hypothetical protein